LHVLVRDELEQERDVGGIRPTKADVLGAHDAADARNRLTPAPAP
jgi:hypothetical protein